MVGFCVDGNLTGTERVQKQSSVDKLRTYYSPQLQLSLSPNRNQEPDCRVSTKANFGLETPPQNCSQDTRSSLNWRSKAKPHAYLAQVAHKWSFINHLKRRRSWIYIYLSYIFLTAVLGMLFQTDAVEKMTEHLSERLRNSIGWS